MTLKKSLYATHILFLDLLGGVGGTVDGLLGTGEAGAGI